LRATGRLTSLRFGESLPSSLCLESLARSLEAHEDARPAGCGLFRARRLQRAGPAGRGSADARSVAVTPPGFQLPEGTDCSGKIARYRAIQNNDLSMGHVAPSVYNQIKRDTDAASKVCAAGRDAEAKSMVAASQRRHGYPTD
jgi:hypothetical protein